MNTACGLYLKGEASLPSLLGELSRHISVIDVGFIESNETLLRQCLFPETIRVVGAADAPQGLLVEALRVMASIDEVCVDEVYSRMLIEANLPASLVELLTSDVIEVVDCAARLLRCVLSDDAEFGRLFCSDEAQRVCEIIKTRATKEQIAALVCLLDIFVEYGNDDEWLVLEIMSCCDTLYKFHLYLDFAQVLRGILENSNSAMLIRLARETTHMANLGDILTRPASELDQPEQIVKQVLSTLTLSFEVIDSRFVDLSMLPDTVIGFALTSRTPTLATEAWWTLTSAITSQHELAVLHFVNMNVYDTIRPDLESMPFAVRSSVIEFCMTSIRYSSPETIITLVTTFHLLELILIYVDRDDDDEIARLCITLERIGTVQDPRSIWTAHQEIITACAHEQESRLQFIANEILYVIGNPAIDATSISWSTLMCQTVRPVN